MNQPLPLVCYQSFNHITLDNSEFCCCGWRFIETKILQIGTWKGRPLHSEARGNQLNVKQKCGIESAHITSKLRKPKLMETKTIGLVLVQNEVHNYDINRPKTLCPPKWRYQEVFTRDNNLTQFWASNRTSTILLGGLEDHPGTRSDQPTRGRVNKLRLRSPVAPN